ncbi:MAG TPA: glycosidase [Planctomycetaceae bacterium]|nr:glycosidase [Planctomycetaceae bacterium]HIQ21603.1 glycosidase [Planctomycetota bacterium]
MPKPYIPFRRHPGNPILTASHIPYQCNTVFNAAACRFQDRYVLVLRVEGLDGLSHLTLAFSEDGYHFQVEPEPWILPSQDPGFAPFEQYGIEDPRITQIGQDYYITYTAYGPHGPRVAIGRTRDFRRFERLCLATEVDNKDAVLFPEKIHGNYVMIDRPGGMDERPASIWITYSPDLVYWGRARVLLSPQAGWGQSKLGACTPPVPTPQGWLVIYHGVRITASGRLYRLGAMMLDRDDPSRVLGFTPHFIFGPEEVYERTGDVPNVVFPCGHVLDPDGTLKLYYGAADTCIGVAEARLDDLVSLALQSVP